MELEEIFSLKRAGEWGPGKPEGRKHTFAVWYCWFYNELKLIANQCNIRCCVIIRCGCCLHFENPQCTSQRLDTLVLLKGSVRPVIATVFPQLWPLFWRKHNLFSPVAESKLCCVMYVCKCWVKRYGCLSHILFVDSEENTLAPVFHSFSAYCWPFSFACFNDG